MSTDHNGSTIWAALPELALPEDPGQNGNKLSRDAKHRTSAPRDETDLRRHHCDFDWVQQFGDFFI